MTDRQINLAIGAITHAELVMDFPDVILDALNSVIAFLATVNEPPERKKGKWDFIGNQLFKCTSCEKVYSQDQFYALQTYYSDPEFPNYCPNCGADMRGDSDE